MRGLIEHIQSEYQNRRGATLISQLELCGDYMTSLFRMPKRGSRTATGTIWPKRPRHGVATPETTLNTTKTINRKL